MKKRALVGIPLLVLFVPSTALGQKAPQALLGKSFIITWTEDKTVIEDGRTNHDITSQTLATYVSTKGQIFHRRTASNRHGAGTRESLGNTSSNSVISVVQFRDRTITMTGGDPKGGMLRRYTVELDERFTTCRAAVVVGVAKGRAAMIESTIGPKRMMQVTAVAATGAGCSVREGNAIAQ